MKQKGLRNILPLLSGLNLLCLLLKSTFSLFAQLLATGNISNQGSDHNTVQRGCLNLITDNYFHFAQSRGTAKTKTSKISFLRGCVVAGPEKPDKNKTNIVTDEQVGMGLNFVEEETYNKVTIERTQNEWQKKNMMKNWCQNENKNVSGKTRILNVCPKWSKIQNSFLK